MCIPIHTHLHRSDEKLAAIGVATRVCHAEVPGGIVVDLEVLVRELVAINALAAHAIALGEVTTLEIRIDKLPSEQHATFRMHAI